MVMPERQTSTTSSDLSAGPAWVSPFVLLSLVGFLGRLSYEMARSPLSPLYARHLGAPTQVIGLIVAAVTVTGIVVKLPSGTLADLWGFRRLMVSGSVVKATAPFIYLAVGSWPQLLVLRFYHGLATALYAPAASALVAKTYPRERARRLGMYSAAENAGVVLGPVVGAAVLAATNFSLAFIVSGIIGTLALLAVLQIRPQAPAPVADPRAWKDVLRDLVRGVIEIAGDPAIRLVSLMEASLYLGVGTLQAYLPLYAVSIHIPVAEIGLLFGAQGVASILSRPTMGSVSDRIGRMPLIVAGVLICVLALIAIPHTANFFVLLGLSAIFGLGTGMVTPSTTALIGDLVKRGNFGSAMGVFGSLWDTGHASGPIVAGFLIAALGYQSTFLIIGVVITAALTLFLVGMRLSPDHPSTV